MERHDVPRRSHARPDVVVISVTVTDLPRVVGRPARKRLTGFGAHRGARTAVAMLLALATVAAIALGAQSSRTTSPAAARRISVPDGERRAIAAALGYPYPLRCLTITVSDSSADFARVNVDRANVCRRYHGYLNATLHEVDGSWRLVLDEGQLFVPNSLLAP